MADHLAVDLRLALGRVARRLRRLYVDADAGPSFLELAVLQRVLRTGPASPSALAGGEGVTSAAIAASLSSLEDRGLIERLRDEADGRRIVVTLTAAGRATLETRDDRCTERLAEVLDGFTQRERDRLAAAVPLLERIAVEL